MTYLHIQRTDASGAPLGSGGITLLVRPADSRGVMVAIAKCRDDQRFDKTRGRIVAAQRLASNRYHVMSVSALKRLIAALGNCAEPEIEVSRGGLLIERQIGGRGSLASL